MKKLLAIILTLCLLLTIIPTGLITASAATSSTNYKELYAYIEKNCKTSSSGTRYLPITITRNGKEYNLELSLKEEGIQFYSHYYESDTAFSIFTSFIMQENSKYLSVNSYISGIFSFSTFPYSAIDSADNTITIDRSTFTSEKTYSLPSGGTYLTVSQVSSVFDSHLDLTTMLFDKYLYDNLKFGLAGLGFVSYVGFGSTVCDSPSSYHSGIEVIKNAYPATCVVDGYSGDTYCTNCGEMISKGYEIVCRGSHIYSGACDEICNECKSTRIVSSEHDYSNTNSCDATCNVCGEKRESSHTYEKVVTKATLTEDGEIVDKCTVCGYTTNTTIVYRPQTFELSTTSYTYNGKVKTPAVTVKDSVGKTLKKNIDYTVTYASGRKNVGIYKVIIEGKGNYTGTKTLSFSIKPTKKTSVSVLKGATSSIGAKSDKKISYSSSNKKIATVSSKGVITAKSTGTATITVKSNNVSQKITVKVVKPYVKISGTNSLVIKKSLTLKATTNTGAKVKWSTSNSKVAKVSSKGKVTGVKSGTAYIYAKVTYKGKTYTAKYKITVKNPSISLNKTSLTISLGESYTLTAKANPKATIKYKSSNNSVAKVSSSGKITTYAKGSAKITAYFTYAGKTYSKTCTVKVTAKDYSKIVLYEDSSVKITFKSAEKSKYDDDEVKLYFNVKNKTGKTLLIQADTVSLNGYSFCDLTMSDEVAAHSIGVIDLSVDDFDFDLVPNIYDIKSIGGQFRIIDDATWESYDAIFKNIRFDGKGIASKPSFNKGKLVYSDSQCAIYYKSTEKSKYDDNKVEMYFYLENKTDKTLLIQADTISVNGYSHNDLIMSDPVLAQSIGIINLSVDDFNFSSINIKNINILGGQFRIIDDATWKSYDAVFTNVKVK